MLGSFKRCGLSESTATLGDRSTLTSVLEESGSPFTSVSGGGNISATSKERFAIVAAYEAVWWHLAIPVIELIVDQKVLERVAFRLMEIHRDVSAELLRSRTFLVEPPRCLSSLLSKARAKSTDAASVPVRPPMDSEVSSVVKDAEPPLPASRTLSVTEINKLNTPGLEDEVPLTAGIRCEKRRWRL